MPPRAPNGAPAAARPAPGRPRPAPTRPSRPRPAGRLRGGRLGPAALALALLPLLILLGPAPPAPASSDRQHIVYFEGTPQELEIYKIYGRLEGPTIMILGGIQGDEPGGFMSADLYVDMALKRGNLIVVPRANFKSIILFDRGPDGDLNRKFDGTADQDPDRDRVEIIKNLMAESDLFLNLHDGSGFFRPVWESATANPDRYGQCIIADAAVYTHPETGRILNLASDAEAVVEAINRDIAEPRYKFHFSNHDTLSSDTRHGEQRKSATYYALTKLGIPAFGIETSKDLPSLEMKIHQHNLAVNAFMELYGVVPEQPRINLDPPSLKYLVISVNGQLPVCVADGQTLMVAPGDTVEVVHVGANYDRGLSVDFIGLGGLNDIRLPLAIEKPTAVIARRDNVKFGQIHLQLLPPDLGPSPQLRLASTGEAIGASAGWLPGSDPGAGGPAVAIANPPQSVSGAGAQLPPQGGGQPAQAGASQAEAARPAAQPGSAQAGPTATASAGALAVETGAPPAPPAPTPPAAPAFPTATVNGVSGFRLEVDGRAVRLAPGETLALARGAKVKMVDIDGDYPKTVVMNLRGFVGRPGDATGHDKGTTCDTATDLIPRFAVERDGATVYQIGAEDGPELLAAAWLEISEPKLASVTIEADGQVRKLAPGQRWNLKPGTALVVRSVELEDGLPLESPRYTLGGRQFPASLPQTLTMPEIAVSLAVFSRGALAGKVVLAPSR